MMSSNPHRFPVTLIGKFVGDQARVSWFDLSQHVSERHDFAKQMPGKVPELTKLHNAGLAETPNPVKSGAKRCGLPSPSPSKPKHPKSERQNPPQYLRAKGNLN